MSEAIKSLHILEFRTSEAAAVHALVHPEHDFLIQTCQRTLWISLRPLHHAFARRSFEAAEAYEFFLRFACGLESQVQGETDVFGQVKTAFRHVQENQPELYLRFRPTFESWLSDTKEIRAQYLQNIGGNNYGALARRLLNPTSQDRTVLLGAGLVSKTVAPYFCDTELRIWNRSLERLMDLSQSLSQKGHRFQTLTNQEALIEALQTASLVIIATPAEAPLSTALLEAIPAHARILHLGAENNEIQKHQHWTRPLYSLTELFELDREQSVFRDKQVRQASEACHQRSLLRSLARSIHIAHGWEDLALFN
jgi:glutamyl-tRNA reductase